MLYIFGKTILGQVGEGPRALAKTGPTQFHAQLGLPGKGRAI